MKSQVLRRFAPAMLLLGNVLFAEDDQEAILQLENSTVTTELPLEEEKKELFGKEWFKKQRATLAESLEKEAGVAKRSMGPAPARPVVRGLGGAHIQIAEDGQEVSDLSATSPDHAVGLSNAQTRSLELIEGVYLLPYGLSVAGARVDTDRGLFLSESRDKSNHRIVAGTQNSPLGGFGSLQSEFPVNRFTGRLQMAGSWNQDAASPIGMLENTSSDNQEAAGAVQWDWGATTNRQLGADVIHNQMEYGIPGGFVGAHREGVRISMERNTVHSGYTQWSDRDSAAIMFSANRFRQIEAEVDGPVGAEFLVGEYSLETRFRKEFNKVKASAGASGHFEDRQYGGFVYTPYTQRTSGALWALVKRAKLAAGFRLEASSDELTGIYANREGSALPQRKFVAHSFYFQYRYGSKETKKMHGTFGAYQTSRIPTVEELYSQGPHLAAYSYDLGNPNLNRELGFGVRNSNTIQMKKWELKPEVYATWYQEYIRTRPSGEVNWSTQLPEYITQGGEAVLVGGSVSLTSPSIKNLQWVVMSDYTWGQDVQEKEPLPAMAPMRIQNSLQYEKGKHQSSISGVYYLAQKRLSEFETLTESNFVVGWEYSYYNHLFEGLYRIHFGVDNIFNQEYQNHLSRIKHIFPEPGRSVYLKVSWQN